MSDELERKWPRRNGGTVLKFTWPKSRTFIQDGQWPGQDWKCAYPNSISGAPNKSVKTILKCLFHPPLYFNVFDIPCEPYPWIPEAMHEKSNHANVLLNHKIGKWYTMASLSRLINPYRHGKWSFVFAIFIYCYQICCNDCIYQVYLTVLLSNFSNF